MSSLFRARPRFRAISLVVMPFFALSLVDVPVADAAAAAPPSGPIKVIQNYSEAIVSGVGRACSFGGSSQENHWYRRFDLSASHGVAKEFLVSEVVVGVDHATSADGILPGRVDVWAIDKADPLMVANLEPLASVPVNWDSASDLSLKALPVTAVVPTGKDLVIEVMAEAGTAGESFSVGANSAPELADDYFYSPAAICGAFAPTPLSALGFTSSNHVLYARGKAMDCLDAEAAVGPAEPPVTSATAAVAKAKGAKKKASKKLRGAKKGYAGAVADHGKTSAQAEAAKARLKKAKKRKAAKALALKHAKAALAVATATLTPASRRRARSARSPPCPRSRLTSRARLLLVGRARARGRRPGRSCRGRPSARWSSDTLQVLAGPRALATLALSLPSAWAHPRAP